MCYNIVKVKIYKKNTGKEDGIYNLYFINDVSVISIIVSSFSLVIVIGIFVLWTVLFSKKKNKAYKLSKN